MNYAKEHHFGPIKALQMGVGFFGPPPVQVYAFLVDGLLIDTGPPKLQKEICAWLQDKPLQQAFITHHHEDHSGNVTAIEVQKGNQSFGSKQCSERVKRHIHTSLPQKLFWGAPRKIHSLIPWDKPRLETPNHSFQIIPVPGHAEDQVALYEAEQGWLFSADAFVSPIIKYFLSNESMAQQIHSLKKLEDLDFDRLLCAHSPMQKGGKAAIRQKRTFLESYYEQVLHYHQKGESPRQILNSMGQKERWGQYVFSAGHMCALNMVKAVLRDEAAKNS